LRQLNRLPDATYETFRKGIENPDPAICTNVIMGLIKVTSYLLHRQLLQLEKAFVEKGGFRERMTRARLAHRSNAAKRQPPDTQRRRGT
jgi:four helix bundle suffix protein